MTTTGELITDFNVLLASYSWRMVTFRDWGRIVVPFRCHVGSCDCSILHLWFYPT